MFSIKLPIGIYKILNTNYALSCIDGIFTAGTLYVYNFHNTRNVLCLYCQSTLRTRTYSLRKFN